jgi:hypothetical protein
VEDCEAILGPFFIAEERFRYLFFIRASISFIIFIFSAFATPTFARAATIVSSQRVREKKRIFYLLFAAADCARPLNPWLLPDLSALDWIRAAAALFIGVLPLLIFHLPCYDHRICKKEYLYCSKA